ncbi:hypothetical protein ACFQ0O_28135 [Saccharopolyspora spinosporotrichia]
MTQNLPALGSVNRSADRSSGFDLNSFLRGKLLDVLISAATVTSTSASIHLPLTAVCFSERVRLLVVV